MLSIREKSEERKRTSICVLAGVNGLFARLWLVNPALPVSEQSLCWGAELADLS